MIPVLNKDITNVHATKLNKDAGGGRLMFFFNQMLPKPKANRANPKQAQVD